MRFPVLIPEDVCRELEVVFTYYEERQHGFGARFLDDWESTMKHLEERPFIYQIQFKEFRSVPFNRFPFLIIYKVEEKVIVIYKLIHMKRNPARRFNS